MTRILSTFLFAATLTITAFSQTPNQPEVGQACNLSLSQAPAIRGIRLGMKPDEWLKVFPGSAQDERMKAILDQSPQYPEYGLNGISFHPPSSGNQFSYLSKEEFSGINSVSLTLFDNQIIRIYVNYSSYYNKGYNRGSVIPIWDDVSQLIAMFSETYNLPKSSAWDRRSSQQAVLQCLGFELELHVSGTTATARLSSKSTHEQIMRQRSEAERQKGRAAFKP